MDLKVYMTQQWLNNTYSSNSSFTRVDEDGITGWGTIRGLIQALRIELGVTPDGVFGNGTANAFTPLSAESNWEIETIRNQIYILQGALYCKGMGLDPGTLNGIYNETTVAAVKKFQGYAGLSTEDQNGITDSKVIAALLNTDAYTLLSNGDSRIREIQQALNKEYYSYIGLIPCDGVFSKKTMRALISGLQVEEKKDYPNTVVDGVWGPTTMNRCPTLQQYGTVKNRQYIYILQYALYANGFNPNGFDGIFGTGAKNAVTQFQTFCGLEPDGIVGPQTWASLMVSYGDQSRVGTACDFMRPLNEAQAQTLVANGRTVVGRYITGGSTKKLTKEELQILYDAGLKVFPIYQTSNNYKEYFTEARGRRDAHYAFEALRDLYFPNGTTVYFAVDFDATVDDVNEYILPYFAAIKETYDSFATDKYKIGIYGPRYVCTLVRQAGYSESSFVCDMSSGFACNIGFALPTDWAFDQISTITIGEGDGAIEIDNNIASGRNEGARINPETSSVVEEADTYVKRLNITSRVCSSLNLPTDIFAVGGTFNFGTEFPIYAVPPVTVYLSTSLTGGFSGDYTFSVGVTNGVFSDPSIISDLNDMIADIGVNVDSLPIPKLNSLAMNIVDGKLLVKVTPNIPANTISLSITCVVYDLETKDPGSVYIAVTARYEIGFGDQTLDPEAQKSFAESRDWLNSIDWESIRDPLIAIGAVFVCAALVYVVIGGYAGLSVFLSSLISFFAH